MFRLRLALATSKVVHVGALEDKSHSRVMPLGPKVAIHQALLFKFH